MQYAKYFPRLNYILFLTLLVSLLFSFRAISSICIALIIATGIISNKIQKGHLLSSRLQNPFFIACCLMFFIDIISLCWTKDMKAGVDYLQVASGLLFTPLAVCVSDYITESSRRQIVYSYVLLVTFASLFCLSIAVIHFFRTGDHSAFFYHKLVVPVKHHAIYFSILVFAGLINLIDSKENVHPHFKKYQRALLIAFLTGVLILLSSKLVLIVYLLFLLFIAYRSSKAGTISRVWTVVLITVLALMTLMLVFIRNPVRDRFQDILDGDPTIFRQEKFETDDYFNGLQFRLLQWKFTGEILSDQNAWLLGLGPGDAQPYLDQKYKDTKMYTGDPAIGTTGFLGYNTHNQFLEALLQTGIIGLAALILVCFALLKMVLTKKKNAFSILVILLICWLFTESVFETQFGILIFTFFPLLHYFDDEKRTEKKGSKANLLTINPD